MNIAMLTTRLFDKPRSGGELCTARLLTELVGAGHRVHVLGRGPAPPDAACGSLRYTSLGPAVQEFDTLPLGRQLGVVLRSLVEGQALTVHRQAADQTPSLVRRLLLGAGRPAPDALWLDHLQVWPWVAGARGLPAPVLVMHNLESRGYAERAAYCTGGVGALHRLVLRREDRLLRRLEHEAMAAAAAVACLSEQDADQLRLLAADSGAHPLVEVLPGFPREGLRSVPLRGPRATRRIGLIGSWTWAPNRAALNWMLDRVLPLLPPTCRVVLAGAGLERCVLPDRVQSLGRVDDAGLFYDQVDMIAIPALQGSGVQEKAIEAIVCGLPVVAMPLALRGLGWPLPEHVVATDDPGVFARACAEDRAVDAAAVSGALANWTAQRRRRYRLAVDRCLRAASAAPISNVAVRAAAAHE